MVWLVTVLERVAGQVYACHSPRGILGVICPVSGRGVDIGMFQRLTRIYLATRGLALIVFCDVVAPLHQAVHFAFTGVNGCSSVLAGLAGRRAYT